MKMKRRSFLSLAIKLAAAGSVPAVLTACGGGGGSSSAADTSTPASSDMDKALASVESEQDTSSSTHNTSSNLHNEVATGESTSTTQKTTSSLDSLSEAAKIYNFYSQRSPDYSNSDLLSQGAHYLYTQEGVQSASDFWQKQVQAHSSAYTQYLSQITKLKAAARLYDFQMDSAGVEVKSEAASKSAAMVVSRMEPALFEEFYKPLLSAVSSLVNLTDVSLLTKIEEALKGVLSILKNESIELAQRWTLNIAANLAIDSMLDNIAKQSIQDLDFSSKSAVMLSLAKVSFASMAIIGSAKIQDVTNATSSSEKELIDMLLSAGDLSGKMLMVWTTLMNQIMQSSLSSAMAFSSVESLSLAAAGEDYSWQEDRTKVQAELKEASILLSISSLFMKSLFAVFEKSLLNGAELNSELQEFDYSESAKSALSFASGSTADNFRILFTSAKNADDQILSSFMAKTEDSSSVSNLQAILNAFAEIVSGETTDFSDLADKVMANFTTAGGIAADAEAQAFDFASLLAQFGYDFASNTEGDAFDFASLLAQYAFEFTMDIEEDAYQFASTGMEYAYNFAMQGMEYGYLFASRGEEVGVMANRILWMAVQIGVMADRIGEMADRILYTEQMIVYTEILILDFGVLIYGTMKQIINMVLMGMAIILDREWYEPSDSDPVLDMINNNVVIMLENMNGYSLAMLEQQQALRQLTLDALPFINDYYEQ